MPKTSPAEAATKWAGRLAGSTAEIQSGVQRVKEAPTQKAAKQKAKMLQNLTRAVQNGKWEKGLNRVSLSEWQRATIEKGIPRIAQGAEGARSKVQSFYSELFPYQDSLQAEIEAMPSLTLEDSVNRAVKWIRGMSKFERS